MLKNGVVMNFLLLPSYYLCDFAESYLGYSLKGSGRFVKMETADNVKILKVKRFFSNRCDNNEFTFTQDSCLLSRNYWHSEDITKEFEKFYAEQVELTK